MFALQNSLANGILNEFRKRFALRKDTLKFKPELWCDANGGDGGCLHFNSVLQSQFIFRKGLAGHEGSYQPTVQPLGPLAQLTKRAAFTSIK